MINLIFIFLLQALENKLSTCRTMVKESNGAHKETTRSVLLVFWGGYPLSDPIFTSLYLIAEGSCWREQLQQLEFKA